MGPLSAHCRQHARGERASKRERDGVMKFLGRIYDLAEAERAQGEREHEQLE